MIQREYGLIHVSKFQDVQDIVYKQVSDFLDFLRDSMQASHYMHDDTISKFEEIWHKNFYIHKDKTDEKMPTWQELLDHKYSLKFIVNEVCQNIKVLNGDYVGAISDRTHTLASFALTGFANFGSIGVLLGGIGGIAPDRRADIASLSMRALLGGFVATLLNASIAALLL